MSRKYPITEEQDSLNWKSQNRPTIVNDKEIQTRGLLWNIQNIGDKENILKV